MAVLPLSANLIDSESNFRLNPPHPPYKESKVSSVQDVDWDERLFQL